MNLKKKMATKMVVCPSCDGEGRITTGEWYEDRDTGAHSPITEECDLCAGLGGVPDQQYDGPPDDLISDVRWHRREVRK